MPHFRLTCVAQKRLCLSSLLKSDDNGVVNVKMAIGLVGKTTILHVHHASLFISLLSLHDYDVKMPKFTFYGERNAPINVNPEGWGVMAKGGDLIKKGIGQFPEGGEGYICQL